uniref:Uncharacterized protein n=1 Tax=Chromera velia CCMP2878 TaxID=1169474 RepID=A0A0G4IEW6_9ALVE|eukprot:Cvel_13795.t1-p1 / transcript=Cvel_13795.t1 / gene=Cvel_13795 / organism=Chromera_velia_CCMP2878 / gene_product=hypothetical protein / transcript_product=hypothetical protein / location=Cvel_scaffold956:54573-55516(+) / protein_length=191 / sequence_SO=supercontig / SO=protein_coding / is_pseudo=false
MQGPNKSSNLKVYNVINQVDVVPGFPLITSIANIKMLHVGGSNRFVFEYVKPRASSIFKLALAPFHLWAHKLEAYRDAVRDLYYPQAGSKREQQQASMLIHMSGLSLGSCDFHFPEDMPFGELFVGRGRQGTVAEKGLELEGRNVAAAEQDLDDGERMPLILKTTSDKSQKGDAVWSQSPGREEETGEVFY